MKTFGLLFFAFACVSASQVFGRNVVVIDSFPGRATFDTTVLNGNTSVSGLLQTGNENRFVVSLLSDLTIGNHHYQISPLTSVAYSSKPHAQVEGEYLENVIIRLEQNHLFYPAAGLSFEKSFLRKISERGSAGVTAVCNLLNLGRQSIKLGVGINYEVTKYVRGAFQDEQLYGLEYQTHLTQIYIRLKGKIIFSAIN
jgi:hypothetical protein